MLEESGLFPARISTSLRENLEKLYFVQGIPPSDVIFSFRRI